MCKRFWMLGVFLLSCGFVQAEVIRFEPAPQLLQTFYVVVEDTPAQEGKALLLNATTGKVWVLELKRAGDVLKSPALQAIRPCDQRPAEIMAIEISQVGDLLVAATELGEGASTVAKVGPRPGECTITLEVQEGAEWKPATTLGIGKYRLKVECPPYDKTCEQDVLPGGLTARMDQTEITLALQEADKTGGVFFWTFSGDFQLDKGKQELIYRLAWEDQELTIPSTCRLVFRAGGKELMTRVETLAVEIGPSMAMFIPAGCGAKLQVLAPSEPDEVLWYVPGRGWFSGYTLEFVATDDLAAPVPVYPYALLVRVFVRKGNAWGTTQMALTVTPRPELTFVDAKSGQPIKGPWPINQSLKVQVAGIPDFVSEGLFVRVGKLGPEPMERKVGLRRVQEGLYESEPLVPEAWQTKPGDILWVEFGVPAPILCVVSAILPLR
ncbi:MAG: hypothetical protein NZ651_02290 [Candidatus Bipolaricaulota bacterium]|nr:hypothetical protein [Candidatus Bipolaricaulota bacterium]MDW8126586.1 hypothetical protein [Candidatus Bipolaricaulota bacterium]